MNGQSVLISHRAAAKPNYDGMTISPQNPIVVVGWVAQAADVDLRAISQAFENRYFT